MPLTFHQNEPGPCTSNVGAEMLRHQSLAVVTLLIASTTVIASSSRSQSPALVMTDSGSAYVIGAPVSQLTLTIPKGNLVADRPGKDPMYFSFADDAHRLIVSGWFSPANGFRDIKEFWAAESANWKQRTGFPEPSNVTFEQTGSWNLVFYDVVVPGGVSSNVRAHWVEAGTWIDLHVSKTAAGRSVDLRTDLRNFLKTLAVTIKGRTYGIGAVLF